MILTSFTFSFKNLTIVEQNEAWLNYAAELSRNNIELFEVSNHQDYFTAPWVNRSHFDIIIFDSSPEFRIDLVKNFLNSEYSADLIILDDSSYYSELHVLLSDKAIHREDFIGLAPIEEKIQVTSFFYLTEKLSRIKSDLSLILGSPQSKRKYFERN